MSTVKITMTTRIWGMEISRVKTGGVKAREMKEGGEKEGVAFNNIRTIDYRI